MARPRKEIGLICHQAYRSTCRNRQFQFSNYGRIEPLSRKKNSVGKYNQTNRRYRGGTGVESDVNPIYGNKAEVRSYVNLRCIQPPHTSKSTIGKLILCPYLGRELHQISPKDLSTVSTYLYYRVVGSEICYFSDTILCIRVIRLCRVISMS